MSRRQVAALTAVIVFPVVLLAIVLTSLLESDDSKKHPAQTTQPADQRTAPDRNPGSQPSLSPPARADGAKPAATPLSVLARGAAPKPLSEKLGPAASDGTITLDEMRGAPIVLNIWSADCTPCRDETRVLESEWERLGRRGVLFLGLNVLDQSGTARQFRAEYDVTYPSVEEKRADTARELGARGVPETFFISKSGEIVSHVIGTISLAQIELGVNAARTGHARPTDQGGGQVPLH